MCGVLGFVDKRHRLSDAEHDRLWRCMLETMAHRGGEGDGVYRSARITLAHTRLRILDINPASDQPFFSSQCHGVLAFNGQIYNHQELKQQLSPHFAYRTESDTETLLYAYARWGRRFVHALRGMYAFGIWDGRERRIVLGVDFLGIKPLYYLNDENWFAWSSEVKPLLLLPGVTASLDESALHEFVCYRSLTGARTMFRGIYRLTPSQMLVYDPEKDRLESSAHWHPETFACTSQTVPTEDLGEALRESVREHARADVPIGVQLSGGLDSSLVARLLRDSLPRDYELHSYCVGPTDSGFGEFGYARRAARAAGTIHHEIRFDGTAFAQSLHKATLHLDEPLNHPNTVPLLHLAGAARAAVKVLFSGEGADELFCGYKRHARFLREPASVARLAGSNQVNHIDLANSVFRHPAGDLAPERLSFARAVADASPARQLTLYDLRHHLPALLLRQDKMGMAANLEIRVPYLDKRLVEMALALTDSQKITSNDRKVALRAAAAGAIPRSIAGRLKRGFGLPVSRWLKSPIGLGRMFERQVLDERRRSFLNYGAIGRLYAEHQRRSKDNSDILWPILSLEVWCRCFLDGEAVKADLDLGGALPPPAKSYAQQSRSRRRNGSSRLAVT